mgnify:CR=1 FL=1
MPLAQQDILPRIEGAIAFARSRHIFLAEHRPSGVPIDVSLAWLPFEEEAIAAAEVREVAGVRTRVARPEDLVIYKMVAARPRDLDDIEHLLRATKAAAASLTIEAARGMNAQLTAALHRVVEARARLR